MEEPGQQDSMREVLTELGLSSSIWKVLLLFTIRVLVVVIVMVVTWIAVRRLRVFLEHGMQRARVEPTVGRFAANLVQWGIFVLVLLACMSLFGVETTSFAAVMGGASVALGLGFQGSLSNVAAGIMLLVFRPYKIGDYIMVEGKLVIVYAIELFFTTVDTFDNRRLFVPNSKIFGNVIENHTYHEERRVDIKLGLSYDAEINTCREVLEKATELEGVTRKQIYLDSMGDFSVNWVIRCWTDTERYFSLKEALVSSLKTHCDASGLEIPYPYSVTVLKSDGACGEMRKESNDRV